MTKPDPLEPAIEAGLRAAHEFIGQLGLDEDDMTDFELGVGAAVRAAAPIIAAQALIDADKHPLYVVDGENATALPEVLARLTHELDEMDRWNQTKQAELEALRSRLATAERQLQHWRRGSQS